jgi:hypothetical protein
VDEEDECEEDVDDEEGEDDEDDEDEDENEEDAVLAVDNGDGMCILDNSKSIFHSDYLQGSQRRNRIECPYDAAEVLRAEAERLASKYQTAIVPEDTLESGCSDFKERIASYPTVDDGGIWRVFANVSTGVCIILIFFNR